MHSCDECEGEDEGGVGRHAVGRWGVSTRRVYEAGVLVTWVDFLENYVMSIIFVEVDERLNFLAWQLPSPSPEHTNISSTPTQIVLSLSQVAHSTPLATSSLSSLRMLCARIPPYDILVAHPCLCPSAPKITNIGQVGTLHAPSASSASVSA